MRVFPGKCCSNSGCLVCFLGAVQISGKFCHGETLAEGHVIVDHVIARASSVNKVLKLGMSNGGPREAMSSSSSNVVLNVECCLP